MRSLGIAQTSIVTVALMLAIGIAFLSKPGTATLYWVCAFALGMVATFGVMAGGLNDAETIRRLSLGALMGAPGLLWSGFRAHWGVRPHVWAGPVVGVLAAITLVAVGDSGWYATAYRTVFLVAAGFAVLFVIDWLRFADRHDWFVLPLAIVSLGFAAIAIGTAVAVVPPPPAGGDTLGGVRVIASVSMLFYVAAAVVAVVGVSTRDRWWRRAGAANEEWERFHAAAVEKLADAQRAGAPVSMVHLRLDDLTELRQAAGSTALSRASDRLENVARSIFPPQALVCSPRPGTVFVLVARTDTIVRELLRECLDQVAHIETPGRLPVRPSASIGWASTATVGYDASSLAYLSREAAAYADHHGGDRWERVNPKVIERMLGHA
jgi:hypothetical protein